MFTFRNATLALLLLTLTGCSQPAAGPSSSPQSEAPRPPKILRLALGRQIEAFVPIVTGSVTTTGGGGQVLGLVSNRLQNYDEKGNKFGELAESLPSVANGTWKINPDGTMETSWKLRPNLKWHDGKPITTDDVLFGYKVVTTPGLPTTAGTYTKSISELTATDSTAFVIRWKEPFVSADEPNESIPVLPKHILEAPLATTAPNAFANLPYFTSEFVGSGPFKLTGYEPGVQTELAAFDEYYRGRPKLDRVIVRAIADFNTQIASVLAGDIDLTLPTGIDVDSALSVEERWQGTENHVLYGSNGRLRMALAQSRPEEARPSALTDPRVLQALFRSMDRALISEAISRGKAPPGNGIVPPFYDVYKDLGPSEPAYAYDLTAAQRALADLGWNKGGDGVLRNAQGEAFHTEISGGQSLRTDREMNSMANGWKQLGIQVDFLPVPLTANTHELRWNYPGFDIGGTSLDDVTATRRSCKAIPTAANQWRGSNRSGYCSQEYEGLIDRLQTTIDPTQRLQIMKDAVRFTMTQMTVFPMYWDLNPILAVAGVKNVNAPTQPIQMDSWNSWQWDKD